MNRYITDEITRARDAEDRKIEALLIAFRGVAFVFKLCHLRHPRHPVFRQTPIRSQP